MDNSTTRIGLRTTLCVCGHPLHTARCRVHGHPSKTRRRAVRCDCEERATPEPQAKRNGHPGLPGGAKGAMIILDGPSRAALRNQQIERGWRNRSETVRNLAIEADQRSQRKSQRRVSQIPTQ